MHVPLLTKFKEIQSSGFLIPVLSLYWATSNLALLEQEAQGL